MSIVGPVAPVHAARRRAACIVPPIAVCPECGQPLALVQPRERDPDRLLGTCLDCPRWWLVETQRRGVRVTELVTVSLSLGLVI